LLPGQVNRWVLSRFRGTHKSRLQSISAVLWGFLSGARLGVSALGRALSGEVLPRHKIKRVYRLLSNDKFEPGRIMVGLCREARAHFGALVISLDWVEIGGGRRALVASACTHRGRALPMAWRVVSASRFHRSQNAVEDRFMEDISGLVDVERSCVIADRGFRRARFLGLLNALGFGYVIRVSGHVHVRAHGYQGLLGNCGLREGRRGDLGFLDYREDGLVRTRVVWHYMRAHDDAWLLATNLRDKSVKRLCEIYSRRMEEEESFRDLKSHRFGFALRYVKLSKSERYERLLAIWAMGMWIFYGQGHAAVSARKHYGLSTAPNSRIDLSLVRIGHLLLHMKLGPPQALFKLLAA